MYMHMLLIVQLENVYIYKKSKFLCDLRFPSLCTYLHKLLYRHSLWSIGISKKTTV